MADSTTAVEPVVREIIVQADVETCFTTFVDGFATWWPVEHHIGEERTIAAFTIEPFVGGRCFDVDTDGGECQWGTVLLHDAPTHFALAWHIQGDWTVDQDPAKQSEVHVTFEALDDERTAVRLEHRNLDRHGPGGEGLRTSIDSPGGWGVLIGRFGDVAEGREPRPLPPPPR
jgi:hypothetical protein